MLFTIREYRLKNNVLIILFSLFLTSCSLYISEGKEFLLNSGLSNFNGSLMQNFQTESSEATLGAETEPIINTEYDSDKVYFHGLFKDQSFSSHTNIHSLVFLNELKKEFTIMIKESINE